MGEKNLIQDVLKQEEELKEKLNKVRKVIDAYRDLCDHNWVPDGHDSHHDFVKCNICKETSQV